VDYRNPNIAMAYYVLALSWSPAFCTPDRRGRAVRWQCEENAFGYVVHGLWPQAAGARSSQDHPRHCKAPEILAPEVTRPFLCTIPGAQLAQDEWVKHGACAFPDAKTYFSQIQKLYGELKASDPPQGRTTAGQVRRAFATANAAKGLKPEHIQVRVKSQNQFNELFVCYDKQFRFRACEGSGTPDNIAIEVAPRRSVR
jgi:ribonuclease T2